MENKPIISFKDADILNGESIVIYGLDMEIHPGDFVYIVGKVGTGKTSIIRTMIAENPLKKGKGEVCGYNLNGIKPKDIPFLRRKLGVVFQDFQLLMDRSVEENLEFVLKATGWKKNEDIDRRIGEVLEAVGRPTRSPTSCPEVSSSASPLPAQYSTAPSSSSRMSLLAILTMRRLTAYSPFSVQSIRRTVRQ